MISLRIKPVLILHASLTGPAQMERDSIEVIQHLKKDINSAQKECQIVNDQLKEVGN